MRDISDIDFLIIGSAKCATTWLQRCLQTDGSVYMPDPELHYFSREYHRGQDWYVQQFECEEHQQTIGEKSNSYVEEPAAIKRIREALPSVKLIVQMRDPVERAYSDYCMLYRRGEAGKRIEDYLDPRHAADQRFIANGRYAEQIDRCLQEFSRESFLFLLYENIRTMPDRQLGQTRSFLGLPDGDFSSAFDQKVKDKTTKMISPTLKSRFKPLKKVIKPWRSSPLISPVLNALQREIVYPPMPDTLRERLVGYYAPHNESLQKMINLDLEIWQSGTRLSA